MTSFYRTFSKEEIELAQLGKFDFGNLEKAHPLDHPSAFDIDFMERVIQCMSEGQFVELPCYDFKTFQRLPTTVPLQPPDVVIFVGMYTLFSKIMREQFSLRVFVDVDSDVRMSRQGILELVDCSSP
jgi:uridine kinase